MKYPRSVVTATFLKRPNRFIAHVLLAGKEEIVHVANTGRCKELLVPGCQVILLPADNPARRTAYTLVAVYKGNQLINMDSAAPNQMVKEALESGLLTTDRIQPEYTWGNSRFDFTYYTGDTQGFIEVKGVTLEIDHIAYFPDAPTARGTKHIKELIRAQAQGFSCHLWLVIQMEEITCFRPNTATDLAFASALQEANLAGVDVKAYGCHCTPQALTLAAEIPIHFF